jgi:hypothetical protein
MAQIYNLTDANVGSKFAKSAESKYQDGLDRDEARANALKLVTLELRVAMSQALAGDRTLLDSTRPHPHAGCNPIETSVHRVEAVNEVMDSLEVQEAFFLLLKECDSTHASALRKLICEDYATSNAENIAQARGLL